MNRRLRWMVAFSALLALGAVALSYRTEWKQIAQDQSRLDWLRSAKGEGYVLSPFTTSASQGGLAQIPLLGDFFSTKHVELMIYVQNDAGARTLLPLLASCPMIIHSVLYHCDDVSPQVLSELKKQSCARALSPVNPPPGSNPRWGRHVPGKNVAGRPLAVGG